VEAVQSEVERARRDLERTALLAPFEGTVAQRFIEPFQEINAGEAVFVIEGSQGLEAQVLVPETIIHQVAYGDPVRLEFPTLMEVQVVGTVAEIGSRMDAGNAFPVTIWLGQETNTQIAMLRPGMTVRATFALSKEKGDAGYLIPLSAIVLDGKSVSTEKFKEEVVGAEAGGRPANVFVYDGETGTVRRVTVMAGDLRGNMIEVFTGLSNGDRVVTAGVAFLNDGMPVNLWSPDL
jgi:RND family efflux transporter MFP subunit